MVAKQQNMIHTDVKCFGCNDQGTLLLI